MSTRTAPATVVVAEQLAGGEPVFLVAAFGTAFLDPEQVGLVLDVVLGGFGQDGRGFTMVHPDVLLVPLLEIGRASCRERVSSPV